MRGVVKVHRCDTCGVRVDVEDKRGLSDLLLQLSEEFGYVFCCRDCLVAQRDALLLRVKQERVRLLQGGAGPLNRQLIALDVFSMLVEPVVVDPWEEVVP